MTFKDALHADVNAFINADEFADYLVIEGVCVKCLVDRWQATEVTDHDAEGVFLSMKSLFAATEAINALPGGRPKPDRTLTIDGRKYLVIDVTDQIGLTELTLNIVQS